MACCIISSPVRWLTGIALVALLLTWRAVVLGDWVDWLLAGLALAFALAWTEVAISDMRQRRRSGRV